MLDPLDGQGPMYRRTASKEELERPLTWLETILAFVVMVGGTAVIIAISYLIFGSLFGSLLK